MVIIYNNKDMDLDIQQKIILYSDLDVAILILKWLLLFY